MIDARQIIASVFKDLYLFGLREIRLRQTEFSIYLVEQLSSIPFDARIFELRTGLKYLVFSQQFRYKVIENIQLLVGVSGTWSRLYHRFGQSQYRYPFARPLPYGKRLQLMFSYLIRKSKVHHVLQMIILRICMRYQNLTLVVSTIQISSQNEENTKLNSGCGEI